MRLDQALLARGLASSRSQAQALITAGAVLVDGQRAVKPALKITDQDIVVTGDPNPYVSRAAQKLLHGLDHFGLDPAGQSALDLGASTGGFTQVLLERGAAHVFAIDVGHGQLHPDIAADPRVTNYEGVNARALDQLALPPVTFLVADLSFISLTKALPPALLLVQTGGTLLTLIKPQFEAGRVHVGKGGIVRDRDIQAQVCARITEFLQAMNWQVQGVTESPITGSEGNREFLIAARKYPPATPPDPAGH